MKARAESTEEIRINNRGLEIFAPEIHADDDRKTQLAKTQQLLIGLPGGREVAPSNWAFGQIAGLAKAPSSYLRTLPSPIVADAVQYGLRYNRDAEDIKLYADDLEAMAITGPGLWPDFQLGGRGGGRPCDQRHERRPSLENPRHAGLVDHGL